MRIALSLLLSLLTFAAQAEALRPVNLQLKWRNHFQFAGYYLALEKGYYREAGLDVRILPWRTDTDVLGTVLDGRADFGVAGSELVLARAQGRPVVALAVIFQHSPAVLFARRAAGIDSVHDLPGKRVVLHAFEAEPFAYLQHEGVSRSSLIRVPLMEDYVEALLAGRVDVITGYSTVEAYKLRQAGLDFLELTPRAAGLDFYGDTLFTREALVRQAPELVAAFRSASLRGWVEAMADIEATAAFIHRRYAPALSMDKLRFEGEQMRRLIFPGLIEMGYQHQGRWNSIVETYKELGMLAPDARAEGLIYQPARPFGAGLLNWVTLSTLAGLLLVAWIAQRFYRLSRSLRLSNLRLTERLAENQALQEQLRSAAERDPLTGLYNRRFVYATLSHEFARADREGYAIGLVMLDVDHFKAINDSYGHAAGDKVLQALAELLRSQARGGDILCRWGGEEFLLVLPRIGADVLLARIEQVRRAFAELTPLPEASGRHFSFSAGIALYPRDGKGEDLIGSADQALYAAKHAGRNRVMAAPGAE
ncbi:MAG: diguanylate cyclase domain-containing protein [Pseudomonas sp.]